MTKTMAGLMAATALALGLPALAKDCPQAVTSAVGKAHAGARQVSCKEEREDGAIFYEVKIKTAHGSSLELEVSPDGAIVLTEERIAVSEVPAAVLDAVRAAHADAKVSDAERHTAANGEVSYEVTFTSAAGKRSMEVTAAGKAVVDEEDDDADKDDGA